MKTFLYILCSILTFFLPLKGIIIAIGFAIMIDTFAGIHKAYKTNQPIISKRLSDLAYKMLIYEFTVLFIYVIDRLLISEFFILWFSVKFFFTKIVALVLIFIELVSLKENIEEAYKINLLKMLRSVLKHAREIKEDITDLTGK